MARSRAASAAIGECEFLLGIGQLKDAFIRFTLPFFPARIAASRFRPGGARSGGNGQGTEYDVHGARYSEHLYAQPPARQHLIPSLQPKCGRFLAEESK